MKRKLAVLFVGATLAIAACEWPSECDVCWPDDPGCGPWRSVKVETVSMPAWVIGHLVK